jgi:signal transduction histidine kinase
MADASQTPAPSGSAPLENALLVERLHTIGRLASGLGVDLRQSLSVIRNSLYFLNGHLGETLDDKTRRHLGLMWREVDAANRIVSNLAWLAVRRPPDREPSDVEVIVHAALNQLVVPARVSVETAVPPHATIFGDPSSSPARRRTCSPTACRRCRRAVVSGSSAPRLGSKPCWR